MSTLRESELNRLLKSGSVPFRIVLIHGDDEAYISHLRDRVFALLSKQNSFQMSRLDKKQIVNAEVNLSDTVGAINLFGDQHFFSISDCDDSLVSSISSLLTSDISSNFVFLAASALGKSSKLRNLLESASTQSASIAIYSDTESLKGLLLFNAAEKPSRWQSGADELFLELVGTERSILLSEFEKLKLFCAGSEDISVQAVLSSISREVEFELQDVIDDAFLGNTTIVVNSLEFAKEDGSLQKSLIVSVLNHIGRLITFRAEHQAGRSIDEIIRSARPPVFFKRVDAIKKQISKWNLAQLLKLQTSAVTALSEARRNSHYSDNIAERLLLNVVMRGNS